MIDAINNEHQLYLSVETEISYFLRCSDCECCSEDYFSQQQAASISNKLGWKDIGGRVVCHKCAVGYPKQTS